MLTEDVVNSNRNGVLCRTSIYVKSRGFIVKTVFKLSVLSGSLLVAGSGVALTPTNAQLQDEIRAIVKHDQQLQHEVKMLKTQLQKNPSVTHKKSNAVHSSASSSTVATTGSSSAPTVSSSSPSSPDHAERPLLDRFDHPITVTTSPLMGPTADLSDILEQMSKDNQQLTLLRQRAEVMKELKIEGDDNLNRPIMELSGGVEGQLYGVDGFNKGDEPRGISLSTAEFDIAAIVGPWAGALLSYDYDNSPASTGNRSPKGTAYVDRGFVTLGNLNRFPLYVSIGEMYVPYGRYGSLMLTTPITQSLARTKSDTAMVGFYRNGLYATAFGYNGAQTSGSTDVIKQGGADVGYQYSFGPNASNSVTVGTSFETNLADSQGLQDTGAESENTDHFPGFAYNNSNNIQHRVPAYAAYGTVIYGNWTALASFVTAVEAFASSDLAYGNTGGELAGATPKALHTELDYTIHVWNKPFTFGADYDRSWQALAANVPQQSFTADIQVSWFRNTVEQIEYRHDDDYGSNKSADGAGSTAFSGTGATRNSYLGQIGVYF